MWKRDHEEFYWSAWSHCDAECGLGHERRHRLCVREVTVAGYNTHEEVDLDLCDPFELDGDRHVIEERDCRIKVCEGIF